jgi:CheY-like chemotaxis protein
MCLMGPGGSRASSTGSTSTATSGCTHGRRGRSKRADPSAGRRRRRTGPRCAHHLLAGADDIEIVGEAADGGDVEHAVAEHHPDVVLVDIRMPGMLPGSG